MESARQLEAFQGLSDEAYDRIADAIHFREYKKGAEIVPYKDTSNDVYFILEGRVQVTIFSFSGKEISYQDLAPGQMFGELSAIDDLPRVAHVIALEPTSVCVMSKQDFWRALNEHPQFAVAVLKRLVSLVRFLCDRVYQYGALDVKDRIRAEILRLARETAPDANTAMVPNMPTHAEIASRVSTHREAVTRELNELSKLGLVEQDKRMLTVPDMDKLAELLPEDT